MFQTLSYVLIMAQRFLVLFCFYHFTSTNITLPHFQGQGGGNKNILVRQNKISLFIIHKEVKSKKNTGKGPDLQRVQHTASLPEKKCFENSLIKVV